MGQPGPCAQGLDGTHKVWTIPLHASWPSALLSTLYCPSPLSPTTGSSQSPFHKNQRVLFTTDVFYTKSTILWSTGTFYCLYG